MSRVERRPRRRASRWQRTLLWGAALATTSVVRARAEVIDATSTTLLSGRQDPRDGVVRTALPVYELLSVRATEIRLPGFDDTSVVLSGWGALALVNTLEDKRGIGDLDLAFAEGKLLRRRVAVRLGRQLLMSGAGRNWAFDGLSVTAKPVPWAGLSAHTGVPVTPRFAIDRGDFLVGARAFVKPAFDGEAGVSFFQVLDNGLVARRDLALDAYLAPKPGVPLSIAALGTLSLFEMRLAEAHLAATYQLGPRWEASAGYRRTAPDLFLARNSIFSVFSQETRDEVGGYVYGRLLPHLRLQGDYHLIVDGVGTGHDGSLKLTETLAGTPSATLGLEARRLSLPGRGYFLIRGFAQSRVVPRLLASLDASTFFFDSNINGQSHSFTGAMALAWDIRPAWRAVVTGIGSVTPFAERRFEGLLKVVYQFETRIRKVTP